MVGRGGDVVGDGGIDGIVRCCAEVAFSGVVRIDAGPADGVEVIHESAHGRADRAHDIAMTAGTRLATASVTKGFTALTVMALVESGALSLETTARSVLGDALPLIDPAVSVEHLLAHRSGIAEYCSEDRGSLDPDQSAVLPMGCVDTPSALEVLLAGRPMRSTPGGEFHYNNSGYVVLARIVELVSGEQWADLVERLVTGPAGMVDTAVLRYDELPANAAVGYLEAHGERTNVHHVPVRGIGDGGHFTTTADMARFWRALFAGVVVSTATLTRMTTAQGWTPGGTPYGLGFWLEPTGDGVQLEGADFGISFRSTWLPSRSVSWTVASNWTDGAWPVADAVEAALAAREV